MYKLLRLIPVVREDRAFEHNLFQKLNQLIGEVSCHECFHSDRYVLGILGLSQSCLNNLVNERSSELVLIAQHLGPQLHVTSLDQVASLRLEQTVLIARL